MSYHLSTDEIIDRVSEYAGIELAPWQRQMAVQIMDSHATGNAMPGMRVNRRNGMQTVLAWEAAYRSLLNDYRQSDYETRNV